ncbi:MAG: ABC transporter ATP-binding protein [Tissierellia bacterium]|nr:ABC transporter ATP-binding protein [Tissierellia bacterium]
MMVEVKNLVKRYKELVALDHFNLEVKEGEILGLLGPNGSGKTTAINCMLALLSYDKGEIKIMGKEMTSDSYDIKGQIGIVPQEVALFQNLTVRENLDYFAGLYIDDSKKRKEAVEYAIRFVGLESHAKYKIKKLSGGLKRRANIACGIAHKPKLIFFDEPTVAVDAQSRNFILQGIKQLSKEGSTIIYTTHYLDEAQQLCDRIVIMDNGKSIAVGSVEDLKKNIDTREKITVSFLEDANWILEDLRQLPHIIDVLYDKEQYVLKFEAGVNNLENLLDYIRQKKLVYKDLYSEQLTLNDVFLELTGKELRE